MSTPSTSAAGTDGAAQRWTKAGPLLAALIPGFALSGLGLIGAPKVLGHIGGYLLLLSALLAFYAASAEVMNAVYGRTVLPLFGRA